MIYIAILLSKLVHLLIKITNRGSGYTWPGHVALTIYPNLLSSKVFKYKYGVILVTGTNGKTTTSKLLTHILTANGLRVNHNKSGGNILNGIASTLLHDLTLFGHVKSDIAVLEVDELTLPLVLKNITPNILMLLNLSRDQLDRYGEVDSILDKWHESLDAMSTDTVVIVDSEQVHFKELISGFNGRTFYFDSDPTYLNETSLHGNFNAKNINAAMLAAQVLGYDRDKIVESLHSFEAAYGRGEVLTKDETHFQLFLAKNPASFNHNLDLLLNEKYYHDSLLFILNDEIRDGRDVSWIYDIDPIKLQTVCHNAPSDKIYVSGSRCLDMVVRLHYAGIDMPQTNISENLNELIKVISERRDTNDVFVLPNYSAMLKLREILTGRQIL